MNAYPPNITRMTDKAFHDMIDRRRAREGELGPTCVYCAHLVSSHDTNEGCLACGCASVVFWDDDRGDE